MIFIIIIISLTQHHHHHCHYVLCQTCFCTLAATSAPVPPTEDAMSEEAAVGDTTSTSIGGGEVDEVDAPSTPKQSSK